MTRKFALAALGFALTFPAAFIARESTAEAAQRYYVTGDIDAGGGILLANEKGGYYMGRLLANRGFPASAFDRQEAWDSNTANNSSYAWSFVWGNGANYCFWVGPSRGVSNVTPNMWASPQGTVADRCTGGQKNALRDRTTFGSHFNCRAGTAQGGTQKTMTGTNWIPFYFNIQWNGGYNGGTLTDYAGAMPPGYPIWYRYTTRDGRAWAVQASNGWWGFVPAGVANLAENAGYWSTPGQDPHANTCPIM